MGLDLLPIRKPKLGFEADWQKAMEIVYRGEEETAAEREKRDSVSVMPFETLGAPRVGFDKAADEWAVGKKPADSKLSDKEFLVELKGYYVLELLEAQCDGLPVYSNGGLYEGVDRTSFRGAFLVNCSSYLNKQTIERAYTTVMRPGESVSYGQSLLDIASRPRSQKMGFLKKILGSTQKVSLTEQCEILISAGKWYCYWGERGHPIHAYF